MKNNDHELTKPIAEKGYKKKYLQRLLEEAETKKQLETWRKSQHDKTLTNREAD